MINKILIADDCDCICLSVSKLLERKYMFETNDAKYHDEAYLKMKRAIYNKAPYDLLICDLDFETDVRNTKLNSGEELILAIRKIQPEIKIIVFSGEVKSFRIKSLFKNFKINAFVHKGRNSFKELDKAIQTVFSVENLEPSSESKIHHNNIIDIEEVDISLLKLTANGHSLEEISKDFKKSGIKPSSESSIEKWINKLRIQFDAKNKIHLIAITKDLGLI